MMAQRVDDVKNALTHFDLEPAPLIELHHGAVNTAYLVGTAPRYVMRVTRNRSREYVAQEAALVRELRTRGFAHVPEFVADREGSFSRELPSGIVSIYRYVDGNVNQPLTDRQFAQLVKHLPHYLSVMGELPITMFPGRRGFATPDGGLERAEQVYRVVALQCPRTSLFSDRRWTESLNVLNSPRLIHSDLHAGNFVWTDDGSLVAIIDFERFCIASPAIELAILITGTCFERVSLREDRLRDIVVASIPLLRSALASVEQIIDVCMFVALYFFGRVNRHLIRDDGASGAPLELRDLKRALQLEERRDALKARVRKDWS